MSSNLWDTFDLDLETKLSILSQMIGFNEIPVSIMDFIHDDYYLGNEAGFDEELGYEKTFDIWRDALNELFPDPITMKSSFICNTGAIGCVSGDTLIKLANGKSVKIKDLYDNRGEYLKGYGTEIISYDNKKQAFTTKRIANVVHKGYRKAIELVLSNGNSITKVTSTNRHQFMLANGKFYPAKYITKDDLLKSQNGLWKVIDKCCIDSCDMYDLSIRKYHNYCIETADGDGLISHNTGKTTFSKISILYSLYKMNCCKSFYAFNRRKADKKIVIGVSHNNKYQAQDVIDELQESMENSPYFKEQLSNGNSFIAKYVTFKSCRAPNDFVGTNMPIWFGTELNDYKPQSRALELIDCAISRVDSRFKRSYGLFNCIILDSSDRGVDAAVPIFLKENPYGRQAVQFRFAHWEAVPGEYWNRPDKNRIDKYEYLYDARGKLYKNENYGKPALTFRVYTGDSEIHPCIIDDDTPQNVLDKLDPDRFIDVPNENREAFEANIEIALQEKCGKATETANQYFNPTLAKKCFTLPNKIHRKYSDLIEDVIKSSFFDNKDQYYDYLDEAIEQIPKNRGCFLSLDLGLSKDFAGCAIGYVKNIGDRTVDGITTYDPEISIPIAFAISRYAGEETSIPKIIELIKWVHQRRTIHIVATDRMQSYAIEQACLTMDIPHVFVSIEKRQIGPWKLLKDAMYRAKVDIVNNIRLLNETLNVYYDEELEWVNHHNKPNANNDPGSDSKDILDAVVRLVKVVYDQVNKDVDSVLNPKIASISRMEEYTEEYTQALMKAQLIRQMKTMFAHVGNKKH